MLLIYFKISRFQNYF